MQQFFTKHILALAFLAATLIAFNAKADTASQCSIDHAVKGAVEFKQCPVSSENNDILTAGFDGVRLDASTDKSKTPVWAFNTCRYVDNASASALFIPLKSVQEWLAFIANPPAKVSFAGCCEPRPMRVSDIPAPPSTEACASGWVLKGLVDTSDHKKLVATPDTQAAASLFTLAAGIKDDATYPITKLPIARDDNGTVLPDKANPSKTYAAKYSCGDKKDYYIDFHMQCHQTEWVNDSTPIVTTSTSSETITPVVDTTNTQQTTDVISTDTTATDNTSTNKKSTANCDVSVMRTYSKKCSNGAPGFTAYRQVFNSCTKQIENQIVANTCAGISGGTTGCLPSTSTNTTSCPIGQTGSITTKTDHICDGSNGGAGRDSSTIISNTCTAGGGTGGGGTTGCLPVDTLTTTPCSDPSVGGIITLRRIRVCDGSNGGAGTTTETVVSNTCTASGCVNSIMLKTSTVCQGGTLVRAKVYNSCTKQITDTVISNTCK